MFNKSTVVLHKSVHQIANILQDEQLSRKDFKMFENSFWDVPNTVIGQLCIKSTKYPRKRITLRKGKIGFQKC